MATRDNDQQLVGGHDPPVHAGGQPGPFHEAQVGLPLQHLPNDLGRVHGVKTDRGLRVPGRQTHQPMGQQMLSDGKAGRNAQSAVPAASQRGDPGIQNRGRREHIAPPVSQQCPGGGQSRPSRSALDQSQTHELFHPLDPGTDGRLADTSRRRGPSQAPGSGHGHEQLEGVEVRNPL